MSVVYLATDLRLKRKVALKVMSPELAADAVFRDRFIRESELAASLDHPNVIPIYEAGEGDGVLFIAMRYVEGTDLGRLIQGEGAVGLDRTQSLLRPVAEALDAAHAGGLVHRDVKPANILIGRAGPGGGEQVYLSDFGLTKRTESVSGLTKTGQFMGTIDYVAPEQVQGKPVTGAADQYALACVAYQCLTGRAPFRKESDMAVMWAHVNESPPSVVGPLPGVSVERLDAALGRAMAKAPADRFPTCADFVVAVSGSVEPAEADRGALEGPSRPDRRRRRAWWGAAAAALAVAAGVIGWTTLGGNDGQPRQPHGHSPAGPTPTLATLPRGVNRIDLATNRSVANVPVENPTVEVAVGGGFVWVTDTTGLAKVNPQTNKQVGHIDGTFLHLAGGPDGVWTFDTETGSIDEITGSTYHKRRLVEVIRGVSDMAYSDGYLWYTNARGAGGLNAEVVVVRVDPKTGKSRVFSPKSPPGGCSFEGCERSILALGAGAAWYINEEGTLTRMDTTTGEDEKVSVPKVRGVAFGEGFVWVLLLNQPRVIQLDPDRMEQVKEIPVGPDSLSVTVASGSLWAVSRGDGTVWRIDTVTGKTVQIGIGAGPGEVAVDDQSAWVVR